MSDRKAALNAAFVDLMMIHALPSFRYPTESDSFGDPVEPRLFNEASERAHKRWLDLRPLDVEIPRLCCDFLKSLNEDEVSALLRQRIYAHDIDVPCWWDDDGDLTRTVYTLHG